MNKLMKAQANTDGHKLAQTKPRHVHKKADTTTVATAANDQPTKRNDDS